MFQLDRYRDQLRALHDHICPRQVLGLRMGELAAETFDLALPQSEKHMLAFVETDGCFADGIMVATGCSLGHRTMRLMDYGKVAVTFVDCRSDPARAIRMWPNPLARSRAADYVTGAHSRWHTQFAAYQVMPIHELLCARPVVLTLSLKALISRPGIRVVCDVCGEEIINEREVLRDGRKLCRTCAGEAYYEDVDEGQYALDLHVVSTPNERNLPIAAPTPQTTGRHHE
jgi:formylmethanofuran dehydrogenase subunit E